MRLTPLFAMPALLPVLVPVGLAAPHAHADEPAATATPDTGAPAAAAPASTEATEAATDVAARTAPPQPPV